MRSAEWCESFPGVQAGKGDQTARAPTSKTGKVLGGKTGKAKGNKTAKMAKAAKFKAAKANKTGKTTGKEAGSLFLDTHPIRSKAGSTGIGLGIAGGLLLVATASLMGYVVAPPPCVSRQQPRGKCTCARGGQGSC